MASSESMNCLCQQCNYQKKERKKRREREKKEKLPLLGLFPQSCALTQEAASVCRALGNSSGPAGLAWPHWADICEWKDISIKHKQINAQERVMQESSKPEWVKEDDWRGGGWPASNRAAPPEMRRRSCHIKTLARRLQVGDPARAAAWSRLAQVRPRGPSYHGKECGFLLLSVTENDMNWFTLLSSEIRIDSDKAIVNVWDN